MEISTNLGFYLPSSDSDDIADINQISDNFRNLDEYIPRMFREVKADIRTKQDVLVSGENIKSVNGKSLLGEGNLELSIEVDQTYAPTSENAQSGIAVAEAVEDCAKKLKKIEFADGETITVEDNTLYVAKTDITSLTIIYPNTDFICSLEFAIVNEGNVTITLPESKYIGGFPSFANGESWEINIKNGVVVGGKVE